MAIRKGKVRNGLTHYLAFCDTCPAKCESKNARAWAAQHVLRHPEHQVELNLGWVVWKE